MDLLKILKNAEFVFIISLMLCYYKELFSQAEGGVIFELVFFLSLLKNQLSGLLSIELFKVLTSHEMAFSRPTLFPPRFSYPDGGYTPDIRLIADIRRMADIRHPDSKILTLYIIFSLSEPAVLVYLRSGLQLVFPFWCKFNFKLK